MYKNLQTYINDLERKGELLRIREFVDPQLEIAEVADRMAKSAGGGKALLFKNTGTGFPVLMNMMGSEQRMLRVLGVNHYDEIAQRIDGLFAAVLSPKQNLWDKLKLLPTLKQAAGWMPHVSKKRGACQEVVMEQPDLNKLPILQCWPYDGGRFITLPMVHTRDPHNGQRNVGMYRMQVFSATTTGMHWHKHKTGARHFREFCDELREIRDKRLEIRDERQENSSPSLRRGTTKQTHHSQFSTLNSQLTSHHSSLITHHFPVAIALGGDPVYTYCATAPLPDNVDEYLLAGFLRNRRVELVHCLTQPLEVPADADFVIEGYIDSNEPLVKEGPFGDHTGFYSLDDLYPLLHVTAITHRRDAVYPATVVGIPPQEDAYMGQATEKIFLAPIRLALAPEVEDLHLPFEGVAHNIALVKIKNSYPGQAIKVAHALWGAGQMMFNKIMVMLDGNVELTDYTAVMREIATNYRPDHDTYFSRGPLDVLDHSAAETGFGGKLCIDATKKVESGELRVESETSNNFQFSIFNFQFSILFDAEVDTSDYATCVWLLGNNVDPARDCKVENGKLVIDARSKMDKRWPNIVCMDDATIAAIDAKWDKLNIGQFIPSPSLKYKHLVKSAGAAATDTGNHYK